MAIIIVASLVSDFRHFGLDFPYIDTHVEFLKSSITTFFFLKQQRIFNFDNFVHFKLRKCTCKQLERRSIADDKYLMWLYSNDVTI